MEQPITTRARAVPVVQFDGIAYFVDLYRGEFRRALNPNRRIEFHTAEGKELCRLAGVICCPRCGASAMTTGPIDEDVLSCMWCEGRIEI